MLRDVRRAIGSFRSWRVGAAAAVLTLAIGIGTTTALYALLRVVLAETATDIDEVERVARLYATSPAMGIVRSPLTLDDFESAITRAVSFEGVAAYQSVEMTAGDTPEADTVSVMRVSPAFFDVLRGRPSHGRLFVPADYADAIPRAVVSELTWRRRFAGQRLADSPVIRLDGRDHVVIGVVPLSFAFPFIGIASDVWVPLSRTDADGTNVFSIARLATGSSWATAAAELATLPPPLQSEGTWRWRAIPVEQDTGARTAGAAVWILLPAVVVLIVGCVNVACMLLARGIHRETELSVRMALGATRGAIFRQLFFENGLIAIVAGALGTALAIAGLAVVSRAVLESRPLLAARLSGGLAVLPVAVTASAAACLMSGLVPALRLSRRDIAATLRGSAPPPRVKVAGYGARDLVVFVELGLAVILVVFTALSFGVVSALQDTRVELAVDELVAVTVPVRQAPVAVERVRGVRGVAGVTLVSALPGNRSGAALASAPGGHSTPVTAIGTGAGFFETAGLAIVRGRPFLPDETADAPVAVIGESGALALWPDEDPIGKEIDVAVRGRTRRLIVIGVARDAMRLAVPRPQPAELYRPLDPAGGRQFILLARSSRATEIARNVARAARPGDATADAQTRVLGERSGIVPAESVAMMRLFGAFALVALLLAGSGIFAVVSQSVAQRTSEFGVRLALGASRGRVLRMVLSRELKLIAAALASGTLVTVALTRSSGFDDAAFIVAVSVSRPEWPLALIGLCGAVAILACGLATYRIVKLDPWTVLRKL